MLRYVPASRIQAGLADVLRRHDNQEAALPVELVIQSPAKLEPALIENGFVQTRLGLDLLARLFGCARHQPGYIPLLQILDTHYRVVLADRGLVRVVAAGIADPGVNLLDFGFGLSQLFENLVSCAAVSY